MSGQLYLRGGGGDTFEHGIPERKKDTFWDKVKSKAKEDEETSFLRVIYEKHWTPDFTLISEHISDVIVRC